MFREVLANEVLEALCSQPITRKGDVMEFNLQALVDIAGRDGAIVNSGKDFVFPGCRDAGEGGVSWAGR